LRPPSRCAFISDPPSRRPLPSSLPGRDE
jgi:hypothetical protein